MTGASPRVNYDEGSVFPGGPAFQSWSALLGRLFLAGWNHAPVAVEPPRIAATEAERNEARETKVEGRKKKRRL